MSGRFAITVLLASLDQMNAFFYNVHFRFVSVLASFEIFSVVYSSFLPIFNVLCCYSLWISINHPMFFQVQSS